MRYISTRGGAPVLDFKAVTLAGLASDGGLYLPEYIPTFSPAEWHAMAGLDYVETAVRVLTPFVGETIPAGELRGLLARAYAGFDHAAVAPLAQIDQRTWLLELFHGPTLAFKDFALQVLGLLFERFLEGAEAPLTVVGATSGDTGSAAIHALAGRDTLRVVMLHPKGRVSNVQRRQMTTVLAGNIRNVAVEGTFDDCQALVKAMFNDAPFRAAHRLSAVNSINWARLLVQVVYYVYAAVRLGAPDRQVAFAVPTGNFGDVYAGYIAHKMGLPIRQLIVATNANDILARALSTGDYSVRAVAPTTSPSMDIQVSSNFERLLFDLGGQDAPRLAGMMASFETTKSLQLPDDIRAAAAGLFCAYRADEPTTAATMLSALTQLNMVIDPHTATGLAAAWASDLPADIPLVVLATAHPAKFPDGVQAATGVTPQLPERMADLMTRPERYDVLPNDLAAIQAYVANAA